MSIFKDSKFLVLSDS